MLFSILDSINVVEGNDRPKWKLLSDGQVPPTKTFFMPSLGKELKDSH